MKMLNLKQGALSLCIGAVISLCSPHAYAVHDNGIFELEGNAVQDAMAPPYDWETLYNGGLNNGGNANAFTGIVNDEPNASGVDDSIFTGGRKDIQDISDWGHKSGSSPDKDEITNAYAAAYNNAAGDTIVYFGADRISNKGDAFMGFWFFKKHIEANPDGSFMGEHTNGDVLVLTNFPQANNASPEIRVDVWDDTCGKAANNNPSVGECDAKNLRLLYKGAAICGSESDDLVCAITNDEGGAYDPTNSPWPYQSKNHPDPNVFPYESIFEGGINLTQLVGGDNCFSSFMAETRSSSEFTATLKDWVLRDFELCSIDITKQCGQGQVNEAEDGYVYEYSGVVTNDGSGTLYNVLVTDLEAGQTHALGTLAKGETANYSGTFESTSPEGFINMVEVSASATPAGASTVTDTASSECDPPSLSGEISVSKVCESNFVETNAGVIAKVSFSGQVCNITTEAQPLTLANVSVTDDKGDVYADSEMTIPFGTVELEQDECKPYYGSYIPTAFEESGQIFKDTVLATGELKVTGDPVQDTAFATCPICPEGE
ncbi:MULTISPECIES: DUF11 domain-containing protein [unclassified Pseudoalteromonas]|uniref:DUF11 domain-containing protein n=1 Tax=unclassified Pseudoalteromonas TaxID=194690 RepID=UPI000CF717BA|nr:MULTISPECIES: DUF11 domain-containing protein [unclassified Pseudoalteromonas]MBS3796759.1 DUF11 domain-containing protein [Pseudoalteromonas sp. BDTF-M6]